MPSPLGMLLNMNFKKIWVHYVKPRIRLKKALTDEGIVSI